MFFLIRDRVYIVTQFSYGLTFLEEWNNFISVFFWIKPIVMNGPEIFEHNCQNLLVVFHTILRKIDFHCDEAHSCNTTAILIARDPVYVVEALEALIQTARTFMSDQYT